MTERIRVIIADDQRVVREGLALVLGLIPEVEVIATVADGAQAVQRAAELRPDVVVMDLRMPRCDGVDATRRLRATQPDVKVLVLTTFADDQSVLQALRAGARGYLTKDAGAAEIRAALIQVQADQAALDPAVQQHVVAAVSGRTTGASALTRREHEVLALIASGLTNTEIAGRLVISEATVKTHVTHVLSKLGARDRAHAISHAYRAGLLAAREQV